MSAILPSDIGEVVTVLPFDVGDDASLEAETVIWAVVSVLVKDVNDDNAVVVASIEGFVFPYTELAADVPDIFLVKASSVTVTSVDDAMVDVLAWPLSIEDTSVEAVAAVSVLIVDVDADDKVQYFQCRPKSPPV